MLEALLPVAPAISTEGDELPAAAAAAALAPGDGTDFGEGLGGAAAAFTAADPDLTAGDFRTVELRREWRGGERERESHKKKWDAKGNLTNLVLWLGIDKVLDQNRTRD
jgi:hypothetical protein